MTTPARPSRVPLPRPRLLACDIDGTLLDEWSELRPTVREAVAAITASGVEVILATGRSPWSGVTDLAAELALPGPHVTMQGALISTPGTSHVLRRRPMPAPTFLDALRFADGHGIHPIVSLLDGHRAGRAQERDAQGWPISDSPTFRRVDDLRLVADHGPMRVYLPTEPGRFGAVRDAAIAALGTRAAVTWSDGTGVEFLAAGTHKGEAVAWLASQRGWGMESVAAVGDAANDRELLSMAGRSAAMGSATEDVAACGDIVVPPSSEAGVLDAFAWFFPDLADLLLDEPAA